MTHCFAHYYHYYFAPPFPPSTLPFPPPAAAAPLPSPVGFLRVVTSPMMTSSSEDARESVATSRTWMVWVDADRQIGCRPLCTIATC